MQYRVYLVEVKNTSRSSKKPNLIQAALLYNKVVNILKIYHFLTLLQQKELPQKYNLRLNIRCKE